MGNQPQAGTPEYYDEMIRFWLEREAERKQSAATYSELARLFSRSGRTDKQMEYEQRAAQNEKEATDYAEGVAILEKAKRGL